MPRLYVDGVGRRVAGSIADIVNGQLADNVTFLLTYNSDRSDALIYIVSTATNTCFASNVSGILPPPPVSRWSVAMLMICKNVCVNRIHNYTIMNLALRELQKSWGFRLRKILVPKCFTDCCHCFGERHREQFSTAGHGYSTNKTNRTLRQITKTIANKPLYWVHQLAFLLSWALIENWSPVTTSTKVFEEFILYLRKTCNL
jgi:hypothetical protein